MNTYKDDFRVTSFVRVEKYCPLPCKGTPCQSAVLEKDCVGTMKTIDGKYTGEIECISRQIIVKGFRTTAPSGRLAVPLPIGT